MSSDIPFEINYDITTTPPEMLYNIIDSWDKITYTEHFSENANVIIKSRFPGSNNCDHIPGMNEMFEQMALSMNKTPLDEWKSRGFINNHQRNNKCSIFNNVYNC